MDLGDSPDRAPPPVELKKVSGSPEGETKLHEANEKTGEFKSYKDRKRYRIYSLNSCMARICNNNVFA